MLIPWILSPLLIYGRGSLLSRLGPLGVFLLSLLPAMSLLCSLFLLFHPLSLLSLLLFLSLFSVALVLIRFNTRNCQQISKLKCQHLQVST
jgi:hypothetical protein